LHKTVTLISHVKVSSLNFAVRVKPCCRTLRNYWLHE